ncbi:LysR substrate-binding domain-containing protein [Dasania sp. GY-MA-18]|uniref:LysR substrate-binding domain-containing protein n=1 Tax=Dasania phycosphaerae TaxID=2950436 RepID=A0A9J6RNY9_9GAMM|nr:MULTISPECIES: LysR substrate-binding domain-containing protein [Dasania]MCR8923414.1 LysR substrate-binding domain-containing protein [Dasania sp. GY-MA-18]MCZ0865847.1 LysR substrate-binding domain-containing protein [Dasania phycosphaerae]MCZ0869571.1 LysR substrate-binding domain-containing protein [Dasania phycosphaerae]
MTKLPPLNALRVFSAVAKHLSFVRAADELCVTHSAVSKQIKLLEDNLEVKLFDRSTTQVDLTAEGKALLPAVSSALELITRSVKDLKQDDYSGELAISTPPAFAAYWLMPRLHKFKALYPKLRINLLTSDDMEAAYNPDLDVCICWGNADQWQYRDVILLVETLSFPVCSPKLLEQEPKLLKPVDLKQHTLISEGNDGLWATWLAAEGVTGIEANDSMIIPSTIHQMIAARHGLGVAMGDNLTCADDLRSGVLVQPFASKIHDPSSYHLITSQQESLSERCKVFIDWLLSEANMTIPT